ncbi:MAG TPA: HD domain-containing protein [Chloroflexia bacterium]|nr:HD domain-containing protein [Chloroflexia bacterium]
MIEEAIELAARAHRGQLRKASDLPYISHPYAVGMLLARAGCPEEMVAAGILHDTVEDTQVTLEDIRTAFGPGVAAIVEGCSESDKSAGWEERKKHTLAYLRTAPWEVRVVSCADKLHNVRTIIKARKELGEQVWQRFKRGRQEQEWYYRGLVQSLCEEGDGKEVIFCPELRASVDELFGSMDG